MKNFLLLVSIITLLSSCGNNTEELNIESTLSGGVIQSENSDIEELSVSGSLEENLEVNDSEVENEVVAEAVEIPVQEEVVVEETKAEEVTPIITTEVVVEENTVEEQPQEEETTAITDDETDALIDDMIGDIDSIFREIESEG